LCQCARSRIEEKRREIPERISSTGHGPIDADRFAKDVIFCSLTSPLAARRTLSGVEVIPLGCAMTSKKMLPFPEAARMKGACFAMINAERPPYGGTSAG